MVLCFSWVSKIIEMLIYSTIPVVTLFEIIIENYIKITISWNYSNVGYKWKLFAMIYVILSNQIVVAQWFRFQVMKEHLSRTGKIRCIIVK